MSVIDEYYVYLHILGDEVVYVGVGKEGSYKYQRSL